eukprot:gb/GFBE01038947.1/.p1 GENE.gb/GFBE01038947.1/~~gb/GFBE01038947.1/.p1  ORF type:complete len:317 (+),score=41.45 gb/GFBE01038947.1/:1-951(+)
MVEGWKLGTAFWFAANVYSVRNVSRLDSSNRSLAPVNYLTPAPYAFTIWAAIYLLEFLFVCWVFLQSSQQAPSRCAFLRKVCSSFMAANAAQVFWCLTFRPSFDSPGLLWISAYFLTAIAAFLSQAHKKICDEAEEEEGLAFQEWFFVYVPITLHFGWTTAAALVNWNGYVARCGLSPAMKLACLLVSLGLATVLSIRITAQRGSTVYGLTVAWAIVAVAVQTSRSEALAEEVIGGPQFLSALAGLEFILGLAVFATGVTIAIPKDMEPRGGRPQLHHSRLSWSADETSPDVSSSPSRSRLGRRLSFWRKGSRLGM